MEPSRVYGALKDLPMFQSNENRFENFVPHRIAQLSTLVHLKRREISNTPDV
jgi:hypothetical protein